MSKTRSFLCSILLVSVGLHLCVAPSSRAVPLKAASKSTDASTIKEARKAAANRKRRILFNDDGGGVVKRLKSPTAQAILDDCFSQVAETHVDTIFYCTKSAGFGLFTHFTKVGQVFTSREDLYANNQMEALIDAGIDPLQVMIDFAKKNKIELFWSMRMNDTHDGARVSYGKLLLSVNKLKTEHPEYLLGTVGKRPQYGAWTAVNYARPQIRELAFRFFEEVCQNYDVDGIELDFWRHPVFFESTSHGRHASDEERAMMTDLVRRIRKMADEEGCRRGRPILISMRVPDSVEYCRAIGLDLEKWLADDLLDLLITSGYFQLNEWDYSVKLARKYGVKVYPSLDDSRAGDEIGHQLRITHLAYRARAAEAWAAGADGIYLYNALGPESTIWRELGDPHLLANLDKDYFGSVRGALRASGGNLPFGPFMNIETLNPKTPKIIAPGGVATARIGVGESEEGLKNAKLKLRLRFQDERAARLVAVDLNANALDDGKIDGQWLEFDDLSSAIRTGANEVRMSLSSHSSGPVVWTDLMLEVRN